MPIVGIDPGLSGAVAVLAPDGTLEALYDVPPLVLRTSRGVVLWLPCRPVRQEPPRKRKDLAMRFDLDTREGWLALLRAYFDAHPALRSECIAQDAIRAAIGACPRDHALDPVNIFAAAF